MDTTLARLDRIPVSRPHRRLLFQGGLGYLFDAMDGAVVSLIVAFALTSKWDLSAGEKGLIVSSGLWGFAIGALIAGQVADRIGRKAVMMYALLFFSIFSVIASFSTSWDMFFWCRVIAGIGLGAESAIVAPFVSEFMPASARGRLVGCLTVFFALGFIGAALLTKWLVTIQSGLFGLEGWQLIQIITALPVVVLLAWRRILPESPRFLLANGRTAEAEAVVAKFEAEYERASGKKLPPVADATSSTDILEQESTKKIGLVASIVSLFNGLDMARRTIVVSLIWLVVTFAFYGFTLWMPALYALHKAATVGSILNVIILIYVAQIPGYLSAALLSDKVDRKWTAAVYMVGALFGCAGLIAFPSRGSAATIAAMVLSFFLTGAYASLYSFTPELFPTRVRATGNSVATAIGRIGGIIAPNLIPLFVSGTNYEGVFWMLGGVLIAGAVIIATAGEATSGQTLEDLNESSGRRAVTLAGTTSRV